MMFFLVSACRLNGSLLTMQLPETLGGLVVETGPGFFPALKLKISICVKISVVNQVPTCIVLYTFDHAVGRGVFPVNVGKKMYVTQIQFLRSFCYLKCPVLFGYITVKFSKPVRKVFERKWRRRYSDARSSSSYL